MKNVLLLTLLSALHLATLAQSSKTKKSTGPEVHFGIKGGLNISSLKISNQTDHSSRASFNVGGLAHIHITDHFAIQPEVFYSGQGGDNTVNGVNYETTMGYINVPVLAQVMFGDGFRLQTGPQIGALVSAHAKQPSGKPNVMDYYKMVDFSWVFGTSYVFSSGFGFDARFNLGMNDIDKVNGTSVKNRVFALGIFYQFMH